MNIRIIIALTAISTLLNGCSYPFTYGIPEFQWRRQAFENVPTGKNPPQYQYQSIPESQPSTVIYVPTPYYHYQPYSPYNNDNNDNYLHHNDWQIEQERARANFYERQARELEQERTTTTPQPTYTAPPTPETFAPTVQCGAGGASCRQFKPRL